MALHILKLCVGVETVEEHRAWIDFRLEQMRESGQKPEQYHTTRMVPKRADEIIGEGSLYWVTKGWIQSRQRILDICPFVDANGIKRCHLVLEPTLVLTAPQARRPFQGWRYLRQEDAPRDLAEGESDPSSMSAEMRNELAGLGLL